MSEKRVGETFTFVSVSRGTNTSWSFRKLWARWTEGRGWSHKEVTDASDITQGRSEAISRWLVEERTPWSIWVDDDMWLSWEGLIGFCLEALSRPDCEALFGVYVPKFEKSGKFCQLFRDEAVTLGVGGDVVPLLGSGFGLAAIRRDLCLRMAERLPRVRYAGKYPGWPLFASLIARAPEDPECPYRHAGEDYSFCARALQVEGKLFADTRLRLGHEGRKIFTWEDAGAAIELHQTIHSKRTHCPFDLAPDDPLPEQALPHVDLAAFDSGPPAGMLDFLAAPPARPEQPTLPDLPRRLRRASKSKRKRRPPRR